MTEKEQDIEWVDGFMKSNCCPGGMELTPIEIIKIVQ